MTLEALKKLIINRITIEFIKQTKGQLEEYQGRKDVLYKLQNILSEELGIIDSNYDRLVFKELEGKKVLFDVDLIISDLGNKEETEYEVKDIEFEFVDLISGYENWEEKVWKVLEDKLEDKNIDWDNVAIDEMFDKNYRWKE
jgi:hypothetical protein